MITKTAIAVFLTGILASSQVVAYEPCARVSQFNTIRMDCVIYQDIPYKVTLKQWYSGYEKLTWYLHSAQFIRDFSFENAQGCMILANLNIRFHCMRISGIKYTDQNVLLTAKKWHDGATYWELER